MTNPYHYFEVRISAFKEDVVEESFPFQGAFWTVDQLSTRAETADQSAWPTVFWLETKGWSPGAWCAI